MPPDDLSRLVRAPRGAGRLPLGTGSRRAGATGGADEASLTRARVHEVCGPARIVFAAMVAGALERQGEAGPVLWIRAPGAAGGAAPDGLAAFFAPDRVVLALPRRVADALWCAEEALRSGAAALVVVELASPADLTPVRRLHLAAEAGAGAAAAVRGAPPLALLLTPGEGGSQGVESRWRLTPMPTLPP